MVHLKGVSDREKESENANQGENFTISGIKYKKAAVIRANIAEVVGNSTVRVNNRGGENRE